MNALRRPASLRKALLLTGALGALALGACREDELAAALAAGLPATQAYGAYNAPYGGYGAVPIGYPAYQNDAFAWGERSYALDRVFYDTPPDYGFNYGGAQPLVWRTQDDWTMYADPYGDDYRYSYYEPGRTYPYYIRDSQYGYGYDNSGRLVAMFNLLGQLMPQSFLGAQAPLAGDYYRRAYDLRRYSQSARPFTITDQLWLAREPYIVDDYNSWFRAAQYDPWVDYRVRTDGALLRVFEPEVRRRKAHPGFPAHARGWGPPFLRQAERRVVSNGGPDQWVWRDERRDGNSFRDLRDREQAARQREVAYRRDVREVRQAQQDVNQREQDLRQRQVDENRDDRRERQAVQDVREREQAQQRLQAERRDDRREAQAQLRAREDAAQRRAALESQQTARIARDREQDARRSEAAQRQKGRADRDARLAAEQSQRADTQRRDQERAQLNAQRDERSRQNAAAQQARAQQQAERQTREVERAQRQEQARQNEAAQQARAQQQAERQNRDAERAQQQAQRQERAQQNQAAQQARAQQQTERQNRDAAQAQQQAQRQAREAERAQQQAERQTRDAAQAQRQAEREARLDARAQRKADDGKGG